MCIRDRFCFVTTAILFLQVQREFIVNHYQISQLHSANKNHFVAIFLDCTVPNKSVFKKRPNYL